MNRDMELIRRVLLTVEGSESFYADNPLKIDGYTKEQIAYNSCLLIDAGLVHGHCKTESNTKYPLTWLEHLNWAGHEFLDAARDEGRWKGVMAKVADKAGSVTVGVLQGLLIAAMKSAVGLP